MSSARKSELRLDWCSHEAARYACEHWHYSKCYPRGKSQWIGVWESGRFVGCVAFGTGSGNATLGKEYGLRRMQMAELTRVALRSHGAPVSRIVAIAVRLIRARNPGLRLLVSFADPYRGHHGGIYQAAGWVYVGATSTSKTYVDKHGREHHERVTSRSGWKKYFGGKRRCLRTADAVEVRRNPGKHKYLFPLDQEMAAKVRSLSKPYPKRPKDQAPTVQVGLGGETPTRPLQPSQGAVA